jgi:regulator of RNase E activity RraA
MSTDDVSIPPVSAIADVLALWELDGWLTPPLMPFVTPSEPVIGSVRTIAIEPGTSNGLGDLYDLLSHDLAGSIVVMAGGYLVQGCMWGEILSTAASSRGAAGVLVDGSVRDLPAASDVGLPLYARAQGIVGPAGRAHVVGVDEAIAVQGVDLIAGDVVVLDATGCVRIPLPVKDEVLDGARRYAAAEEDVVRSLADGVPLTRAYLAKKSVVTELGRERMAGTARGVTPGGP